MPVALLILNIVARVLTILGIATFSWEFYKVGGVTNTAKAVSNLAGATSNVAEAGSKLDPTLLLFAVIGGGLLILLRK
jgi:hypothetical protein